MSPLTDVRATDLFREAVDAAARGLLEPLHTLRAAVARDASPRARAMSLALDAVRWHADPAGPEVSLSALSALADAPEAGDALAVALHRVARGQLLGSDREGHRVSCELARSVAARAGTERAWLHAEAMAVFGDWMSGRDGIEARASALESQAADLGVAEIVLELASLRALSLLDHGDLVEATRHGRRASRMARTESMPQEEYLANIALARIRRHLGHRHLSARILAALGRVAPLQWGPWIAWERRLAGELRESESGDHGPAEAIDTALRAALDGVRATFDAACASLCSAAPAFPGAAREARALAQSLDPATPLSALSDEVLTWSTGLAADVPYGMHGVVVPVGNPHAELAGHSWVLVVPGREARRILHPGLGLVRDVPRVERTTRHHGRTEQAAAVLALAGPEGLPVRRFVPEVYGFGYTPSTHDGVLRVLIHRLRKSLGALGDVHRDDDRLVLDVTAPFLVPDPRTSVPLGERVLRLVATRPGATAKEAASALALPLRTVQNELAQLVADGACGTAKEGRNVCYFVEDTTFSEPTRS